MRTRDAKDEQPGPPAVHSVLSAKGGTGGKAHADNFVAVLQRPDSDSEDQPVSDGKDYFFICPTIGGDREQLR